MKNIFKSLVLIFPLYAMSFNAIAQHRQGIGLHFGANDFYGPQTGKYFTDNVTHINYNVDELRYDTTVQKKFRWEPLVRLTYWYSINKMFDFNIGLSLGNADYPASSNDSVYMSRKQAGDQRQKKLLAELDARINFNILPKQNYIASPYIFAGLTLAHHPINFGVDVPIGAGVNFKLTPELYLNLESAYKIAITDHDQNHFQHVIGFNYWFKPGYKKPVENFADLLPPPDMDKDGVTDSLDKCPTIPGSADLDGCPDSDNDGIADNEDECPLVAGTAAMHGCPDSDNDGIADNVDKCPYVAGTADRGGCPVPDKDNDGYADDIDKCPDQYSKTNNGCPEIKQEVIALVEKAARSVYFETGKATLKKVSYRSLDQVVSILKQDPSLFIDISGHTDNVGNDDLNMRLSQERADACKNYLISRGISESRITAKGYGETMPIADNKTATGRAQNRRTEFKLRNF